MREQRQFVESECAGCMKAARAAYDSRDLSRASGHLRRALLMRPDDEAAKKLESQITEAEYARSMNAAQSAYERRELPKAAEQTQQALELKPDDKAARELEQRISESMAYTGLLRKAKDVLDRSLGHDRDVSSAQIPHEDVLSHLKAHREVQALFEDFARANPNSLHLSELAIERVRRVKEYEGFRMAHLGGLRLSSDPTGARVYLNREDVGGTPLKLDELRKGDAQVRIEIAGRRPIEKDVTIVPGKVLDLGTVSFVGGIKVASDPPGADVYIDGKKKGVTPITVKGLPARPEPVQVKLKLPRGGLLHITGAVVTAGKTTDLGILQLMRPRNVAVRATATASSYSTLRGIHRPERVNDGDWRGGKYLNSWAPKGHDRNPWIKLSLDRAYTIVRLRVKQRDETQLAHDDLFKDILVEFSDGRTLAHTLRKTRDWQTLDVPDITSSYVKITGKSSWRAERPGFNEVEVYAFSEEPEERRSRFRRMMDSVLK